MNTIYLVSSTSLVRSSEAVAGRNSFSFRSWMMRVMLVMMIVVGGKVAWGQTTVTDVLDRALTGVSGNSYSNWSGKTSDSDAVYAGNSAGGNNSIQLRSSNSNSGIVTTASGGRVTKVSVSWNSNTANERTLNIYGKSTAYSAATDLYDNSKRGTLLGTIVYGTSTELTISDDYAYIGMRSSSNAMYLDEIQITWESPSLYTVTYDSNGGMGTMTDNNDYASGATVRILANSFTAPSGKVFNGWNTQANGLGTQYAAGATFTISADITLYAQWVVPCSPCTYITFQDKGYDNQIDLDGIAIAISPDISVTFNKATGLSPKYFETGNAVRTYAKNTFTITATGDPITIIDLSFGTDDRNDITVNTGAYNASMGRWYGSANEVTFTISGASGHRKIESIEVCRVDTYTMTCTTPANGTLLATPNSGLTGDGTENVTVTAIPNEGYILSSITATDESSNPVTLSGSGNTRTFTMPASNVTVSATFTHVPTYTITWSVNGISSIAVYNSGHTLNGAEIPSPTTSDCDGIKVFVGWTTRPISDETDETPSPLYLNSTLPSVTAAVTYYAVFAELNAYNLYSGTLTEGDYIIYYDSKAMDTTVSSNRLQYEEVTPSAGIITTTSSAIVWHIAQRGIYWTIYNNAAGKYAASTGIRNQAQLLESGTDDKSLWTVSGTSAYEFVNKDNASAYINDHLRENGTYGFACYSTSTGDALSLYKASYSKYSTVCAPAVFYDGNGAISGSVVDSNSPYTIGATVTVLGQGDLERPGYSFGGWNTESDGTGDNYSVGTTFTINENVILYAQWTVSRYTVKWLANGLELGNHTYDYGEYIDDEVPEDAEANDYACDGKVFVGWSESAFDEYDGTPVLIQKGQIEGTQVTSSKTYYAVFATDNGITNKYLLYSGTLTEGDYVIYYSGKAMKNTVSNSRLEYVSVTPSNDIITTTNTAIIWHIEQNGIYWTIYNAAVNKYAASTGTKNQAQMLADGTNDKSLWSASGTSTYEFVNKYNAANSVNDHLRGNGTYGFACYGTGTGGALYLYKKSNAYSNYTTFCPCDYGTITGIDNGDMVWAGKNVGADWNDKDNWVVYNNSSEPKYHLTAEAPATSNNVIVVQKADCGITVSPNISENVTCGNLTMFNGLNLTIAENKALTINGDATFTSGIINGNVIFGSSAKVNGASTSSHVDGIVTKSGAANSPGFYFPTGSNGNLGKVEVTNDATNVSVQYFCSPDGFGTNDLPRWWNAADMSGENPFNHVSNVEYWRISSTEAITANFVAEASTDMHFNSETADEYKIPTNIQMAFYDNNRWTNVGGSASIDGNTLSITGAEIPASTTRSISGNYTTFGSKSKSTVLPIELTSFTATCNGRSSLIEWTTATEKNNDFFVLERSNDAINFKEIARVAGAGNSIEPINYAYTDYGARSGDNYYRLVQVDYDGTSTASEIIVANCLGTDGEPEVLAYPNPFGDDLTLRFENFGNIQATVEVYDMLGRMVHTQKVNCSQNDYEVVLRLAGLSDGTYNVRISTADFVITRMVVKE